MIIMISALLISNLSLGCQLYVMKH